MARFFTTVAISCAFLTYLIKEIRGNTTLLKMGSFNLYPEDVAVIPLVVALVSRVDVGRFGLSENPIVSRTLIGIVQLAHRGFT